MRTVVAWLLLGAAGLVAVVLAVPLAAQVMVRAVIGLFDASVWVAMSLSSGADTWSVAGIVGRAAAGALVTREASTALAALVVIAAAALYGLQRLLGTGRE